RAATSAGRRARRPVPARPAAGRAPLVRPPGRIVQPPRHCEVVKGDDRGHTVLVASVQYAPVVRELGTGELARGRLDAGPFDSEPERVEPKAREHRDVLAVAVIEVARIA